MADVTTQELIRYFERVKCRGVIPYNNSQMVAAVRESSLKQDSQSLEQLLYVMEKAYCRINFEEPTQTLRNARDTFATLAYFADHTPSSGEWLSIGPVKAYASREHYGRAMCIAQEIFKNRQIDLMNDVFCESGSDFSSN